MRRKGYKINQQGHVVYKITYGRYFMFRELLRKNQQISDEECVDILINETRGVLSVIGDNDYPYGIPMNHWYNAEDGCIYFHCGRIGHKIDSIKKHSKVSYCVYDQGYKEKNDWAFNVKSVIVFGKVELIDDITIVSDITEKLSYKFTQDTEYIIKEIESSAHKTLLIKLIPEHICGKIVKEA